MLRSLTAKFNDPRLWLIAGAACFVISFLIGYHQAQRAAEQVMALHASPPQTVIIQQFDAIRDNRPTKEVSILAETDIAAPMVLEVQDENGAPVTGVLYPLYPVSRPGRDAVLRAEGAPQRPVKRPDLLRATRPPALGIAVYTGPSTEAAIQKAESSFGRGLGGGRYGRVVKVNGVEMVPGNIAYFAQGAVAATGGSLASDFVFVKPFQKSRMEAVTPPPLSHWYSVFQIGALLCGLLSVFFSISPYVALPRRRRTVRTARRASQFTGNGTFAPIATQDEIADAEAEDRAQAYIAHPVLRMLDGLLEEAGGLLRACVRNRRSPRAD